MKFKSLIPIFIFFLGVAVILFLLGLKSRMSPLKSIPSSTSTTLERSSDEESSSTSKKPINVADQKIVNNFNQLDEKSLCPIISQGMSREDLNQLLLKNNINQNNLSVIRKNFHIKTFDGKKLRLVFKSKALDLNKSELSLMVLERRKNDTFIKHPVPKELRFSPELEDVLKHYKSEEIIYEDQVNIYQDAHIEIIFETIDGKIVNFNMTHKNKVKSFKCVSTLR